MDKLWDPLVFNRVLDNWSEHPFVEVELKDFSGPEWDEYWKGNYADKAATKLLADKMKCDEGWEEIG